MLIITKSATIKKNILYFRSVVVIAKIRKATPVAAALQP
jgi:hypothetical protein